MANYATLKAAIQDVIKTNGNNEITGAILQQTLLTLVNSLGAEYQFAGVALSDTNPGTPDHNVAYIAGSGTFPNFGATTVPAGSIGVFSYDGTWKYDVIGIISEQINASDVWTKTENRVINANGSISSNSGYDIYTVENFDYDSVSGFASGYLNLPIIAFYSGTPGQSTLISTILATASHTDQNFSVDIPNNTRYIVIVGSHSASVPSVTFVKNYDVVTDISALTNNVASLTTRVNTIDELIPFLLDFVEGHDLAKYAKNGYINTSGAWVDVNTIKTVTDLPCKSGDVIRMKGVTDMTGITYLIRGVASDNTVFSISRTSPYTTILGDGDYLITLPDTYDIKYITCTWLATNQNVSVYKSNGISGWYGKIWAGLGDSLTAQIWSGLSWSPAVEAATGLEFKNCGVGGSCLAGNSNDAFWKRLTDVENYNPDLVTILGGANDLYSNIPLGDTNELDKAIAQKDCTTFIGAYSYIIETLLTWKPTLRLVLMTPSYAHTNGTDHTPGIGLTYKDYADAVITVAEYYGLPVVDLYRNMGINKLTQDSTYTNGDTIHWNARGSAIAAALITAKLNEIMLKL